MSVQALSAVLDHSESQGGARLVAIALANHADKNGLTFLGVKAAAEEALVSTRAVQYALRKLEEIDELEILEGAEGGRHRKPLYWLKLPGLSGEITDEHPYYAQKQKGANSAPHKRAQRAQPEAGKGASSDTERAQSETSVSIGNRQLEPSENQQQTVDPPDPVAAIYDFWKQQTGRNGTTQLTPNRRAAIKARLDEGRDSAFVKRAIANAAASPFHQGDNERKARYDDLTLICRNGEKLEYFAELGASGRAAGSASPTKPLTDPAGAAARWGKAKERLHSSVADSTFEVWIAPFEAAGDRDGALVLVDSSEQGSAAFARKRYSALFLEALEGDGNYSSIEIVDEKQLEMEAA